MGKDEAAQQVVAALGLAQPEKHEHPRSTNFLSRMKHQMSQRHARAHPELSIVFPLKSSRPLTGPANGRDYALPICLKIEEGKKLAGRAAAAGIQIQAPSFPENPGHRHKIVHRTRRAPRVVNRRITLAALQGCVQGLNILEDRRLRPAQVLEIDDRFNRWKVFESRGDDANLEPGYRIRVSRLGFQPQPVQRTARCRVFPARKQIGRLPIAVNEGERYAQPVHQQAAPSRPRMGTGGRPKRASPVRSNRHLRRRSNAAA